MPRKTAAAEEQGGIDDRDDRSLRCAGTTVTVLLPRGRVRFTLHISIDRHKIKLIRLYTIVCGVTSNAELGAWEMHCPRWIFFRLLTLATQLRINA